MGARVGRFLGSDSPLTMGVIWSLPIPIWFLTSQTKVVLTESSTFSTLSSCSFLSTVSGKTPDILQGGGKRRGVVKKVEKWTNDNRMTKANRAPQCAMSSESTNDDGRCKSNQSRCSSQEAQLYQPSEELEEESPKRLRVGPKSHRYF